MPPDDLNSPTVRAAMHAAALRARRQLAAICDEDHDAQLREDDRRDRVDEERERDGYGPWERP